MPALFALLLAAGSTRPAEAQAQVNSYAIACPKRGGFSVGDTVVHNARGEAKLACISARSPDTIGICQGDGSGHDNYRSCLASSGRPSFCGENALWFVHCSDLMPSPASSMSVPAVSAVPALPARSPHSSEALRHDNATMVSHASTLCGCSWSSQNGCVVSGQQAIASLTHPSLIEHHCAESQSSEACMLRRQVVQLAKEFEHCLRLPAANCYKDKACQWGAQGAHQCGFDEEQFVLALVGEQHRSHPLIRMIQLHDHCNQLSEESCDAHPFCQFASGHRCDVKHSVVASILLANPSFVLDFQQSNAEATCEAASRTLEASKDGHQLRVCPQGCVSSSGLCLAKTPSDWEKMNQVQDIFSALCSEAHDKCPAPCEKTGKRLACRAPAFAANKIRNLPIHPSDLHVVKVVNLVLSITRPFENACDTANRDRLKCQAAAPLCTHASDVPSWAQNASDRGAASLGLKGILAQATRAVSDGKAGEFINDFLANSPQAVPELTSAFAERFQHLWDTPAEEAPPPPSTTKLSRVVPEASPTTVSAKQSQVLSSRKQDIMDTMQTNTWIMAIVSAVVAAICSGLAFGFLCHARLLRSQARELGGALLDADRDLPALHADCCADTSEMPSAAILARSEA